jgi:hypothetical protein
MSKKTAVWLLVVVAAGVGLFFLVGSRGKPEAKYRTAAVDKGDITQSVTATGAVSAVTTVKVGSQVSGIISKLYVDFNSQVKKGALLAELDPTPFQEKVNASEASLQKAQVDERNAAIALRRQTAMKAQGLTPEADFDSAQANYDSAKASVAQANAALKQTGRTELHEARGSDRRSRGGQAVRRRADGCRVVPGADALPDRAGPDEDAGFGRRFGVGHRPGADGRAGQVYGGRLPRQTVPRKSGADPPDRDRQSKRRHVSRDCRGREPRPAAASHDDGQRDDRRGDRSRHAPRA